MKIAILLFFLLGACNHQKKQDASFIRKENIQKFRIESPAFDNGGFIPVKYTADGENISPPLKISGTPQGTKSLALIVDDPDAPFGTWVHWVVFNISPNINFIPEGTQPQGLQGINDFKTLKYGGPSPPSGTHRYFFKLYALDTVLNIPEGASKKEVEKAMEGHILAEAVLMGKYSRR
ncbi:MAG: YbhB/YbcL family Raf kinase inhibitor-like protein [Elusimicrobia bacterium]|nr:YbhB/YbcL family Raf kinase inhibitor-like protein [Elusimicrobiota bacterium]